MARSAMTLALFGLLAMHSALAQTAEPETTAAPVEEAAALAPAPGASLLPPREASAPGNQITLTNPGNEGSSDSQLPSGSNEEGKGTGALAPGLGGAQLPPVKTVTVPTTTVAPRTLVPGGTLAAGTIPVVRFSSRLSAFDVNTFTATPRAAYITSIQQANAPTPTTVTITNVVAGSVVVSSDVAYPSGNLTAASSFTTALANNPSSIFPTATFGATTVSGIEVTTAAASPAPAPAPSSATLSSKLGFGALVAIVAGAGLAMVL